MKSLTLEQFGELSDMLNSIQINSSDQSEVSLKRERSYDRLQKAIGRYQDDPFDPAKSKALQNAIRNHQTACQSFLMQARTIAEQAKSSNFKFKDTAALDDLMHLLNNDLRSVRSH